MRWSLDHLKKSAINLASEDNKTKTEREAKHLAIIYLERAKNELQDELEGKDD